MCRRKASIPVYAWIDGFFRILPNIAVAFILFLIFCGLAILAKHAVKGWARPRNRTNLGDVLGGFIKAAVIALGAIETIKTALDEAGIDMPFETVVQLFHDQTDEMDGVRGAQREGWPKVTDSEPRPRSRLEITLGPGDVADSPSAKLNRGKNAGA